MADKYHNDERRHHRMLALFATIYCWHRGLNAVFIKKKTLWRVLGISRIEEPRASRLLADVRSYFPNSQLVRDPNSQPRDGVYAITALVLARKPIAPQVLPNAITFRNKEPSKISFERSYNWSDEVSDAKLKERLKVYRVGLFDIWEPTKRGQSTELPLPLQPIAESLANSDEAVLVTYMTLLSQGFITPVDVPSFSSTAIGDVPL